MRLARRSFAGPSSALVAVLATAWGGSAHASLGRPLDISQDGHLIDSLFDLCTVMVSILFVIMCAVIFWAVVAHRDKKGRVAWYEHGRDRKHLLLTAAVTGVIFLGVDGTLLTKSYQELHEHLWNWPTAPNTLKVEVLAQQWGWNIRYAGPDGKFNTQDDIVRLNEMAIPTDTPVFIKMKSKDVIHSLYFMNFRVKQDAIPGQLTRMWFQARPDQTGKFEIGCAQHCGANHYKMRGEIFVMNPADYQAWAAQASADSARRLDAADADAHWGWEWEGD